eukprot:CAMPEP_0178389732 /NCGR_PEP_ID=MMETSP0689_2-20121128/10278_1 /TAXON_ID=160604 /ORGANISM="Amphidinium massartii, Strain CS-259" /LENGTH=753 /DNA_ID=CAMNT_0020010211 /DNA_START=64 /DNA_END=2325 /DNA_ORIENTATION=-
MSSGVCKEQLEHVFLDHAKSRRWPMVKAMLDEQPDLVNAHPQGRWSALHQAAASGYREAVQLLLTRKADASAKNSAGATAAEIASTQDVKKLLQEAQSTPLAHAFLDRAKLRDWKGVVDMLAKHPELVNATPSNRWSALHQASMAGNEDVVRYLLRSRADPMLRAADGKTAADVAMNGSIKSLLTSSGSSATAARDVARASPAAPVPEASPVQQPAPPKSGAAVASSGPAMPAPTAATASAPASSSAPARGNSYSSFSSQLKRPLSNSIIEIDDSDEGTQERFNAPLARGGSSGGMRDSEPSRSKPRYDAPEAAGRQLPLSVAFARGASTVGEPPVRESDRMQESPAAVSAPAVAASSSAASSAGLTAPPTTAQDVPPPSLPAPSVIHKKQGGFSIGAPGAGRLMGVYRFDEATRQLRDDETDDLIGVFADAAIAERPFSADILADPEYAPVRSLPCISVVSSEIVEEVQQISSDGAFFVLPSQLNGAEYPSERTIVARLEDYKYDRTGGPRGQLAVHPASGQFMLDNAACDHRPAGISAVDHMLRAARAAMPSAVAKNYDMHLKNGYLVLPHCDPALQPEVMDGVRAALHTLRCLIMKDVQASGLAPSFTAMSAARHRVSLVFASAVPVDAYMNRVNSRSQLAFQTEIGRLFLVGQYYGAMRAAIPASGPPRRVFLMPLGGGVFNNRLEVITGAISTAIDLLVHDGIDVKAKLDIYGLAFKGKPSEKVDMEALFSRWGKLRGEVNVRAPSSL